jgi:hypothetical protein
LAFRYLWLYLCDFATFNLRSFLIRFFLFPLKEGFEKKEK